MSDRSEKYHDYTLDWSSERIVWLVDGIALRNVSREETASAKGQRFPRTPARIRFSWVVRSDIVCSGSVLT